jgi:hypothetical protein
MTRTGAIASMVLLGVVSLARGERFTPVPRLLRISGPVEVAAPATHGDWRDLIVQVGTTRYRIAEAKITVVRGGLLGSEVHDDVRPFDPGFYLRGPADLLAKIRPTTAAETVVITATYHRGERNLLVSAVEMRAE